MRDIDLAYLAGVIDSDGSIMIRRRSYEVRVLRNAQNVQYAECIAVHQTEPEAIELFKEVFGGTTYLEKRSRRKPQHRPQHIWMVTHRQAAIVAKALLPYLRIKRRQGEIVLALREVKNRGRKANCIPNSDGKPNWVLVRRPEVTAAYEALWTEIRSLNARTYDRTGLLI